eukprot:COSAG06_NODE_606_length_13867_cov_16.158701_4_plen_78_part_00
MRTALPHAEMLPDALAVRLRPVGSQLFGKLFFKLGDFDVLLHGNVKQKVTPCAQPARIDCVLKQTASIPLAVKSLSR